MSTLNAAREGEFLAQLERVLHEYGVTVAAADTSAADARVDAADARVDAAIILPARTGKVSLPLAFKLTPRAQFTPADAALLHHLHPDGIVVSQPHITAAQSDQYRSEGLFHVDLAGNAWLEADGFLVRVEGRRPAASRILEGGRPPAAAERAFTPSATRLLFVLLVAPETVRLPIRDLARLAGISVGSSQSAIAGLEDGGFIRSGDGPRRRHGLRRLPELMDRWIVSFANRLLPGLQTRYCTGPAPDYWLREVGSEGMEATLAGESVAPGLQNPLTTTLYATPPWIELVKRGRLRPVPAGPNVILKERFWHEEALQLGTPAPPLLTCAELLGSTEDRLREVGQQMLGDLRGEL